METIYILFVSACMYGQCAWFEITDPKFTDVQNCYTSGKQFGMTMQTQDPRYEGQFVCVDEKDKESFRQFLRDNGFIPDDEQQAVQQQGTAI